MTSQGVDLSQGARIPQTELERLKAMAGQLPELKTSSGRSSPQRGTGLGGLGLLTSSQGLGLGSQETKTSSGRGLGSLTSSGLGGLGSLTSSQGLGGLGQQNLGLGNLTTSPSRGLSSLTSSGLGGLLGQQSNLGLGNLESKTSSGRLTPSRGLGGLGSLTSSTGLGGLGSSKESKTSGRGLGLGQGLQQPAWGQVPTRSPGQRADFKSDEAIAQNLSMQLSNPLAAQFLESPKNLPLSGATRTGSFPTGKPYHTQGGLPLLSTTGLGQGQQSTLGLGQGIQQTTPSLGIGSLGLGQGLGLRSSSPERKYSGRSQAPISTLAPQGVQYGQQGMYSQGQQSSLGLGLQSSTPLQQTQQGSLGLGRGLGLGSSQQTQQSGLGQQGLGSSQQTLGLGLGLRGGGGFTSGPGTFYRTLPGEQGYVPSEEERLGLGTGAIGGWGDKGYQTGGNWDKWGNKENQTGLMGGNWDKWGDKGYQTGLVGGNRWRNEEWDQQSGLMSGDRVGYQTGLTGGKQGVPGTGPYSMYNPQSPKYMGRRTSFTGSPNYTGTATLGGLGNVPTSQLSSIRSRSSSR